MPHLVLHHLNLSRSHRALWLLEELGLPYDLKTYERNRAFRAPDTLKKVHPLGKSPLLEVDGEVVAESAVVLERLVDLADGRLRPAAGTPERRRYDYWMHFAEGSLMPPLLVKLITGRMRTAPPWPISSLMKLVVGQVDKAFTDPEIHALYRWMDDQLGQGDWFCGESFTAADVQMSFPVEAGLGRSSMAGKVPRVEAWIARVRARDAYQRAVALGGDPING